MIQPPTSEFESGAIGMVRCFNTFAATGRRQLLVKGDAGDVLDLDDGAGTTGWTPSGTQVIHAVTYNTWNHDTSLATLYVAQSVSVI